MSIDFPTKWKDAEFRDGQLICPSCGEVWLHQYRVETFHRSEEDAKTGIHVAVEWMTVTVASHATMNANPSTRRHGMLIAFFCELCSEAETLPLVLAIVQHKGITYVYWQPKLIGAVDA